MARRREARRVGPRTTPLPGYEEPAKPEEPGTPDVAPPPEEVATVAVPAPRPPVEPEGPTLAQRQSRWFKERARFEASLEERSSKSE